MFQDLVFQGMGIISVIVVILFGGVFLALYRTKNSLSDQAFTLEKYLSFNLGKVREDQDAQGKLLLSMQEQLLGLFTNLPGAANDTLAGVRELLTQSPERNAQLLLIIKNQKTMKEVLDALMAKVEAEGTVIDGAVTLLSGLKSALDAALSKATGDDPALVAEVQSISDLIDSKKVALADAITKNTPAPPAPVFTAHTYTDSNNETIVVSQAGALPAAGEAVTVNGAAITTETTYTISGATLVVGTDSKVVSYTAAPTA